jgi:hypothetical protein
MDLAHIEIYFAGRYDSDSRTSATSRGGHPNLRAKGRSIVVHIIAV